MQIQGSSFYSAYSAVHTPPRFGIKKQKKVAENWTFGNFDPQFVAAVKSNLDSLTSPKGITLQEIDYGQFPFNSTLNGATLRLVKDPKVSVLGNRGDEISLKGNYLEVQSVETKNRNTRWATEDYLIYLINIETGNVTEYSKKTDGVLLRSPATDYQLNGAGKDHGKALNMILIAAKLLDRSNHS